MSGLEIFYVILAIYIAVLVLSMSAQMAEGKLKSSDDWVKVIFWPITVVIYSLGVIIWLLIWVQRKLFKGLLLCFYEIKDFFVDVFSSAIDDED